jgi:hypothetical protein
LVRRRIARLNNVPFNDRAHGLALGLVQQLRDRGRGGEMSLMNAYPKVCSGRTRKHHECD